MQSLRTSRWRQPRMNGWAIALLITGYLSFGALASMLHAVPEPTNVANSITIGLDK